MKWYECKTTKELKELGTFEQVKQAIRHDLNGELNLAARSWNDLLKKITLLSNIFCHKETDELWHDGFISETEKYLFCLLKIDGRNRQNILGVSGIHYKNKGIAKKWYQRIAQKIHPDKCSDTRAKAAMEALEEMYREMTK